MCVCHEYSARLSLMHIRAGGETVDGGRKNKYGVRNQILAHYIR